MITGGTTKAIENLNLDGGTGTDISKDQFDDVIKTFFL
jgi:hypothetical protein